MINWGGSIKMEDEHSMSLIIPVECNRKGQTQQRKQVLKRKTYTATLKKMVKLVL